MRVVLTRPVQEARRWATRLQPHGIDALLLPLIEIGAAPDDAALRVAADHADDHAAVMFVSANAVQGFFAAQPVLRRARAWAPGPATREALLAAGVEADRIDAPADDAPQFDSESLWQRVGEQLHAGDRLLLVRGGDAAGNPQGRDWITQRLAERGVQVETVVAYTRRMPQWGDAERAAARAAAIDGTLWLFSSSEAVANLRALLPGQDWSAARALATHPRIEEAVRACGFGIVHACLPRFEAVRAAIESHR